MIQIDARCTACGACLQTCPTKALLAGPKRPVVLELRCNQCLACMEVCPAGAISPRAPRHPIELESFAILGTRVELSHMDPLVAEITARAIHATADVEVARALVASRASVMAGIQALRNGASVVCDVEMTKAAISSANPCCHLPPKQRPLDPALPPPDRTGTRTRSAEGILHAAMQHREGAIWAIGCAPTALEQLLALVARGEVEPALIIGTPVGFVGAALAKQALRATALPSISTRGERGGAAIAGAILNALARLADKATDNETTQSPCASYEELGWGEQRNDQ